MPHRIIDLTKRLFARIAPKQASGGPNPLRFRPKLEACETREVPATLSGQIWIDFNENGYRDSGEAAVAGATVELTDGNAQLTPGSGVRLLTVSDGTGQFTFTDVSEGAVYAINVSFPTTTDSQLVPSAVVSVPTGQQQASAAVGLSPAVFAAITAPAPDASIPTGPTEPPAPINPEDGSDAQSINRARITALVRGKNEQLLLTRHKLSAAEGKLRALEMFLEFDLDRLERAAMRNNEPPAAWEQFRAAYKQLYIREAEAFFRMYEGYRAEHAAVQSIANAIQYTLFPAYEINPRTLQYYQQLKANQ